MTCKKKEQQQGAKNKAELQTKWTTKQSCEETIKGGRNRPIIA
jgi:hypothetical protein